ncbi:hypothetical protein AYO46_10500 [Betaproteobacteria bacterium SCGC AG-212-J23]|nr:hypothetical protein AYO46_10500 [Betaproteobacteria bacterium SCGC AG-212-J23]
MPGFTTPSDVTHVIQLAIAPVFLLTAICTLLNVLTNRLGRAVDRRRMLVSRLPQLDATLCSSAEGELAYLERRAQLIYLAIALAVASALLVCLAIASAFIDAMVRFNFAAGIAAFFVLAMLALIGSLGALLREVFLGVNTERCPIA